MPMLVHVADRLIGRPLMVAPDKLAVLLDVLGPRLGLDSVHVARGELDDVAVLRPEASRFVGAKTEHGYYRLTKAGIAVVPVIGTLVNRGAYIGASSGLTSYEGLRKQLEEADKDTSVRGILLDMDTPGGEAGGAFEIPKLIRDIRQRKPVWAYVNDMAASAGYAIASAADQIWMTETGIVGSIGVVMVHFDRSGALAEAGIKPTIIHAGARKADGNPYGPLPKAVRDRLQGEIEALREVFVASVVAGRPKLRPEDVRSTEAGYFIGASAVEIGLADGIESLDRVLETMRDRVTRLPATPAGYTPTTGSRAQSASPSGSPTATPESAMSNATTAPAAQAPDQAALDAAAARGRAEGQQQGAADERARIAAIVRSEEATGRAETALAIALDTGMTADEARKVLATTPKAAATAGQARPGGAFYEAVAAAGGKPQVQQGGTGDAGKRESGLVAGTRARFQQQG